MSGKAKPLDYQQIAVALNGLLKEYRGKEISRDDLLAAIGACIPIKSKSERILAEMVKDGCVVKNKEGRKVHYTLMDYPILYTRIQKWVDRMREYNRGFQVKNHTTPNGVHDYLERLSQDEFINLIKPMCQERNIKLYVPNGYDQNLIAQLPKEILDKITLYKEV